MNRRRFLITAASVASVEADTQSKLLLPSDTPDESGFRLMWYSPVPAIDASKYRLRVGGLVDKPRSLAISELRKLQQETQTSRMKCVQCWSSRTTWRPGLRLGAAFEPALC